MKARTDHYEPQTAPRLSDDDAARIRRADKIAAAMDNAFRVPGTRITFGWDSVIGLIPGVGDALALAPAAYIVKMAHDAGAPKHIVGRMAFNIGVDWLTGLVPLIGDLFDVGFKANLRNAALLRAHLEARSVASAPETLRAQAAVPAE